MRKFLYLVLVILIIALIITGIFLLIKIEDNIDNLIDDQKYQLKYSEFVEKYADEYEVPASLVYAMIKCESDFDPDSTSRVGAMGLMQMMPATFHDVQKRIGEELEDEMLYDPETSIKYGTYYIAYLYRYFKNWDNAVAAYNAGMGTVSGWLKNDEYSKDGELINIPYSETKRYLEKVKYEKTKYEDILNGNEDEK